MITQPLELFLLGTGTSSAVPSIGCLTSPSTGCYCCRSTLPSSTDPQGYRNIRRNTGAVLRVPSEREGGRTRTLLIDCGKTFYTAALEHWPKQGWREIDALLITHAHADAILGLDDLRGWTLHQNIQKSIDVYCNQHTYTEIAKAFPYLTDVSKATGGGDVPQFNWIVFDDTKPLEILGVRVVPLPVHHGKYFSTPPKPYYCLGFLFNSTLAYLSDVSFIPEAVWTLLERECSLPARWRPASSELSLAELEMIGKEKKQTLQVLVIDCLRIEQHASHFGFPQAIATARRMGVPKTYFVGFGHMISHSAWEHLCAAVQSSARSTLPVDPEVREPKPENIWQVFNGSPDPTLEDHSVSTDNGLRCLESWEGGALGGLWSRPGCDGMRITFNGTEGAWDDVYGK